MNQGEFDFFRVEHTNDDPARVYCRWTDCERTEVVEFDHEGKTLRCRAPLPYENMLRQGSRMWSRPRLPHDAG